jgi:hypothetical protein
MRSVPVRRRVDRSGAVQPVVGLCNYERRAFETAAVAMRQPHPCSRVSAAAYRGDSWAKFSAAAETYPRNFTPGQLLALRVSESGSLGRPGHEITQCEGRKINGACCWDRLSD